MSEKVLVPDIGEFENVEVIELLVNPGDELKVNDPVVQLKVINLALKFLQQWMGKSKALGLKLVIKSQKGI